MVLAKVLIVDDEAPIRHVLALGLRDLAQEVLEAATVGEALTLLEKGKVDLVITDMRIGDGSGLDVARAAARLRPAPYVIAMSGHPDTREGLALGQAGAVAFLAKPFELSDVRAVLAELKRPGSFELQALVRRVLGASPMPEVLDSVRRAMVFEALARNDGNKAQAAQMLGISRQHLQKILARGKV